MPVVRFPDANLVVRAVLASRIDVAFESAARSRDNSRSERGVEVNTYQRAMR